MFMRASFKFINWKIFFPESVNVSLNRNAIKIHSKYATEGTFNIQQRDVVSVDQHNLNEFLGEMEDTGYVVGNDASFVREKFARFLEDDVKAYYLLVQPCKKNPFYVEVMNPRYKYLTNKVVTIDFNEMTEYFNMKADNALFTFAGSIFIGGTLLYMWHLWKNGDVFVASCAQLALYFVCVQLYRFSGASDAWFFLSAIFAPRLGVEMTKSIAHVDKVDVSLMTALNVVIAPITYFLWRRSFQSAFARGLFAATFGGVNTFIYLYRQNNKKNISA
jgi:hypothetical protein